MKRQTLLTLSLAAALSAAAQVTIDIDADNRGPKISDTHYGIFFEDINHAADGGLYAELIRNRSFEDGPRYGAPADMQAWTAVAEAPSRLDARLIQPTKKQPLLNAAQHNAIEMALDAAPERTVRIENSGFWGINTVQGRTYRLSLWLKGKYKGTLKAQLRDGKQVYAEAVLSDGDWTKKGVTMKQWTRLTATMTATDNNPRARFALEFDGKGTLQMDMVSLFPPTFKNRDNGLRPDLADMLLQLRPKFVRFPGGCFVEGQESPDNAFRWERTIGPIEEREGHWNVNWGYRTTDGIGFHEYLEMAEDLGAKPLYVVNVGLWHGGLTPVDSLQPWIDECLAALEYANGPVTSKYGAMRARNGHPAPFNIEYLEIGNENNQPDPRQQSDRYYDRFKLFKEQILAKYPKMHLIGNLVAWGDDNPEWGSQESVELVDEHYYRNPSWFADAFRKYDAYPRQSAATGAPAPRVYVGEYAVTNGFGDLGNLNAALGEAVYMMGMENNSDIVVMNSYAPIFVNENDAKWRPDMIRFNSHQTMGTPSYYVQQLMAQNVGTRVVRVSQQNPYAAMKAASLTPEKSFTGFATWATQATFRPSSNAKGNTATETVSGNWRTNDDGSLSQKSMREQCVAIEKQEVDGDHYLIKYRARKDRGNEGFIIVFNYVDKDNYCWANFGGWGNTQHGLEQVVAGSKMQTQIRQGSVEEGRWYDVTLQVEGNHVKAWLDNDLVFDTDLRQDTSMNIYSSATIDEKSGEMIVKIVNTQPVATTALLRMANHKVANPRVTRLTSIRGTDENSLDNPTAISPRQQSLTPQGNVVEVFLPAHSLNIVRL